MPRVDLPEAAHLTLASNVVHLDVAAATFDAMVEGWSRQQQSRLLAAVTVDARVQLIRRFQEFTATCSGSSSTALV